MLLLFGCAGEAVESGDDVASTGTDPVSVTATSTACADPSARVDGPMVTLDPGADWSRQQRGDAVVPTGWGLVVADLDGDEVLDVFLPQPAQDELYLGNGDGTLRIEPFPGESDAGLGATAADPDGDGDLDLYVAVDGQDRFYRNDEGSFTEVGEAIGLAREEWRGIGAAFADMDGDDDLDLVVTNNYSVAAHAEQAAEGVWEGDPNLLYENLGDGTFRALDPPAADAFTRGFGYLTNWVDADDDGDLDLYIVNDKGDDIVGDTLLLNDGRGAFTDVGAATFTDVRLDGMGLGVGDLNGDGLPELAIPGREELALLMSLPDGTWYDGAAALGVDYSLDTGRVWGWTAEFADLDNDGRDDLYVEMGLDDVSPGEDPAEDAAARAVPEEPAALWLQSVDGSFAQVAESWGLATPRVGRGAVLSDLNDDGFLDVVRRDLYGQAEILVSRCGAAPSLTLRLRQDGLNRFAVGAVVDVWTGEVRHRRVVRAGGQGIASSGPPEVHVGLGAAVADRVEIRWPDGATSALTDVAGGQRLTITRGEGATAR